MLSPAASVPLSIRDHNFVAAIRDAYFAFEGLTQHPFDFVSYLYGHCPELMSIDGCAKVISDDATLAHFDQARQERLVDIDLGHQLLKMSMISKMVFRARLRWVTEAPPTFGRRNRISNVMLRTARGKPPPVGSPETGDAGELLRALNGGGMDDLNEKTLDDLKNIYRLCFPGGRGISA